jgi:hypothetical protein
MNVPTSQSINSSSRNVSQLFGHSTPIAWEFLKHSAANALQSQEHNNILSLEISDRLGAGCDCSRGGCTFHCND